MGLTYASLRLTNTFAGVSVDVQALVDSGSMPLCIPESIARQLGFDTTEVYSARIKIADASRIDVPVVAPIRIEFENRSCTTDAYVLGDSRSSASSPSRQWIASSSRATSGSWSIPNTRIARCCEFDARGSGGRPAQRR
jgi:hypothetical protein